ncbi:MULTISPECIES: heme lyase CcmF/NrfE family subunit [Micromonospora]|uniref:Heme lyase CcmF/NrfE family subunit n=1 Tax=Micromonospora solifontis TaxID=2487138 RepID=A0ABX9WBE4_9ACTN|nr:MULTISPECIES: cytochrome c-type biogenesis CcmF C-terminal domain-containing protein [Micromonospora]NES16914.1 cytochrome c biogenesis protein CcsA [Micromonospora sp. PPF5-17B]NES39327.1 cytochrome c biogenesis protein CcsA [Micromonospora solifontis]NES58610.1 cytochrome c biogenesis protein CcsA [Micromonospora sp. PPF5-6]RNL89424.1 heme lyase CcmF/NrfE family subunit [Micromonospora solifontis]
MLGDLGTGTLAAGLLAAPLAALLWLRVALLGAPARTARLASLGALLAAAGGCVTLEAALLGHDFSVRFVAENGGRHVPAYYTITSLWSAMDGSLLLWLLVLGGYGALLARGRPDRLRAYAMVVVSVATTLFFALSTFAANPFRTVDPVPLDGPGPNPLLQQHPAMGVHPPLLYAGYLGTVVPFALALAAPLAGAPGRDWIRRARPWALVAWCTLTAGIVLGAWWSYAVLGWGGYWAWDPVENASLLPWLTTTALLHTSLAGGRGRERWNSVLACAGFLLVLLGTFLTRSGAVASVHAFTDSPLGPLLLGFVLLAVLAATVLTGRRQPASARGAGPVWSRRTAVLGNAVLLVTIAAVVLIGTVQPLLSEPLTGSRASVGTAYYQRTAIPLAVVLLLLAGVAPALRVRDRSGALRRLALPGAAALATVAAVGLSSRPGPAALTAFGAAAFVLTGLLTTRPRRWAGVLGHAGLALVAVGVAASSAYGRADERTLRVGETLRVADVSARLVSVQRGTPGGRMTVRARLAVSAGGSTGTAAPALRYDPARDTAVTVPAIDGGPRRDVYLTLIAVAGDGGGATVRLAVNPLVGLIWAGGAVGTAGGLLALTDAARARRKRPAAPAGRRAPVAAGAPA